jgi:hypothetical protein
MTGRLAAAEEDAVKFGIMYSARRSRCSPGGTGSAEMPAFTLVPRYASMRVKRRKGLRCLPLT